MRGLAYGKIRIGVLLLRVLSLFLKNIGRWKNGLEMSTADSEAHIIMRRRSGRGFLRLTEKNTVDGKRKGFSETSRYSETSIFVALG